MSQVVAHLVVATMWKDPGLGFWPSPAGGDPLHEQWCGAAGVSLSLSLPNPQFLNLYWEQWNFASTEPQ